MGNLECNDFRVRGATAIALALRSNSSLTNLNMRTNEFGNEGAEALLKTLEMNHALVGLRLEACEADFRTLNKVEDVLFANRTPSWLRAMRRMPCCARDVQ